MGAQSRLSRSPTPPHWREEIRNRSKVIDDQQRSKWEQGQGDSPARWERGAVIKDFKSRK